MKELTIKQAEEAIEELQQVDAWKRIVAMIRKEYPKTAVRYEVSLNYDGYNDMNYYTEVADIKVYDAEDNQLFPTELEISEEDKEIFEDGDFPDHYAEWISDKLYELKMQGEGCHYPTETKYTLDKAPNTKYSKLYGE